MLFLYLHCMCVCLIFTGRQHSLLCRCPVLAVAEASVRPSVRPSVTSCCPIKTTQARITKSSLSVPWKRSSSIVTVCMFMLLLLWRRKVYQFTFQWVKYHWPAGRRRLWIARAWAPDVVRCRCRRSGHQPRVDAVAEPRRLILHHSETTANLSRAVNVKKRKLLPEPQGPYAGADLPFPQPSKYASDSLYLV